MSCKCLKLFSQDWHYTRLSSSNFDYVIGDRIWSRRLQTTITMAGEMDIHIPRRPKPVKTSCKSHEIKRRRRRTIDRLLKQTLTKIVTLVVLFVFMSPFSVRVFSSRCWMKIAKSPPRRSHTICSDNFIKLWTNQCDPSRRERSLIVFAYLC